MSPREVDDLELWEAAAVLGRNEPESWPTGEHVPTLAFMRRRRAQERGERVPDPSEPCPKVEYDELLALVRGGRPGGGDR